MKVVHSNRWLAVLLVLFALVVLAGCDTGNGAPNVDWTVTITNEDETLLTLSFADLAGMEQTDLADVLMERSTGETLTTSWSGVDVAALLTQAGIEDYSTITAVAADGYAVEITHDEMEGAIIALKDGEDWINTTDPDSGPIRLVCPTTPANRWVFQLTELRVNP